VLGSNSLLFCMGLKLGLSHQAKNHDEGVREQDPDENIWT
jgi:hypothetical protein